MRIPIDQVRPLIAAAHTRDEEVGAELAAAEARLNELFGLLEYDDAEAETAQARIEQLRRDHARAERRWRALQAIEATCDASMHVEVIA
jgi:predicted aminopeptidase